MKKTKKEQEKYNIKLDKRINKFLKFNGFKLPKKFLK